MNPESSGGRALARATASPLHPAPSRTFVSSPNSTPRSRSNGGAPCPPRCELCGPLALPVRVALLSYEALQPRPGDRIRRPVVDRELARVTATLVRHGVLTATAVAA